MALCYLINLIIIKAVGHWLTRDLINKDLDYKINLRFKAQMNMFTKNKKFKSYVAYNIISENIQSKGQDLENKIKNNKKKFLCI